MWETSLQALMLIVGGLLGSAHCLGMCGGFVVSLGASSPQWRSNFVRQLTYAAGRISVYAFAGAAAGFTGWRLELQTRSFVNAQAILCFLAGALLILEGCWSLNVFPRLPSPLKACPMISFGTLLRTPSLGSAFAAGIWNGFLPCGLVYAYLALAASTNSVGLGAAVMLLFGLGTIPALVAAGLAGSIVPILWRRRLVHAAAICLLAMGCWTIVRAVRFVTSNDPADSPTCPFCSE